MAMGTRRMSAAAREFMYGSPPPPPEPRPEQAKYTIQNCGIGWRESTYCIDCKHCWTGGDGPSPDNPECWHPSVKREKPYPHGPAIDEKREVEDGGCDKFEERE